MRKILTWILPPYETKNWGLSCPVVKLFELLCLRRIATVDGEVATDYICQNIFEIRSIKPGGGLHLHHHQQCFDYNTQHPAKRLTLANHCPRPTVEQNSIKLLGKFSANSMTSQMNGWVSGPGQSTTDRGRRLFSKD